MLDIYNISTKTAHHTNLINFNKNTRNYLVHFILFYPSYGGAHNFFTGSNLLVVSCSPSYCLFLSDLQMQYKSLICRVVIFLCIICCKHMFTFSYFIGFSSFHGLLGRICKLHHHTKICCKTPSKIGLLYIF